MNQVIEPMKPLQPLMSSVSSSSMISSCSSCCSRRRRGSSNNYGRRLLLLLALILGPTPTTHAIAPICQESPEKCPKTCHSWSVTNEVPDMPALIGAEVNLVERVPLDGGRFRKEAVATGFITDVNMARREVYVESDCCVEWGGSLTTTYGNAYCGKLPFSSPAPTPQHTYQPSGYPTANPTSNRRKYTVNITRPTVPFEEHHRYNLSYRIDDGDLTPAGEGPLRHFTSSSEDEKWKSFEHYLLPGSHTLKMYVTDTNPFSDGWAGANWTLLDQWGNLVAGPYTIHEGYEKEQIFAGIRDPTSPPSQMPTRFPTAYPTTHPTFQRSPVTTDSRQTKFSDRDFYSDPAGCEQAVRCRNITAQNLGLCRDCDTYYAKSGDGTGGCKDKFWKVWAATEEQVREQEGKDETLTLRFDRPMVRDPNYRDVATFSSAAPHRTLREGGGRERKLHQPIYDTDGNIKAYTAPHKTFERCTNDQPFCISYTYTQYRGGKNFGTEFGSGQIAGCSDLGCDHLRWRFEGRYTATDDGPIDGSEYDCERAKQNAPPGLDVECPDQDVIYENWKCYDCRTANCNGNLAGRVNRAGRAGPALAALLVLGAAGLALATSYLY